MRRAWLIPLALLGLLLLIAAGLWLFRLPLAERGLAFWLESKGLRGSAEVVRLDLDSLEVRDLVLEGQRAETVRLAYDLPTLLGEGEIERVEVEGLRLEADLTAEQPFGRLPEAFAGESKADEPGLSLPVLPAAELRDAELDLVTARGPLRLALDGRLQPASDGGEPSRHVVLDLKTLEGPLLLSGGVDGLYRPQSVTGSSLTLLLEAESGPPVLLTGDLEVEGSAEAPELRFSLHLSGDLPLLGTLAALPEGERPVAGSLALGAEGRAAAKPLLAGDLSGLLTEPAALPELKVVLQLSDLALPGLGTGMRLSTSTAVADEPDGRRLRLQTTKASAERLEPAWLESLGLPPALARLLETGAELELTSAGPAPVELRLAEESPAALLDLTAVLAPAAGGRLETALAGELALSPKLEALPGDLAGSLSGSLRADNLAIENLGRLQSATAGFALELGSERSSLALQAPVEVRALAPAPAALADLPEGWRPLVTGPLDLTLAGDAPGTAVLESGRVTVILPRQASVATGGGALDTTLDGSLALAEDGSLRNLALSRVEAAARDLPTPYGRLASMTLSGSIQGAPRAATGEADLALELADLALEGAGAADVSATLPLDLAWDQQALALSLRGPGSLALHGFAESFRPAAERVELALQAAAVELAGTETRVSAEASLSPTPLDLDGRGRKDDLRLSAGRLAVSATLPEAGEPEGSAELEGLDATYRDAGLAIHGAALNARFGAEGRRLELARARLASTGDPAIFPSLDLSGSAELEGSTASYRLRGQGLQGALQASAQGRYDLEAGRGTAEVAVEPLTFAAGGPQPADLNPALDLLERATGALSARASLRLGDSLSGKGTVGLRDLGFTVAGTRVSGFDLDLALGSLSPPTSPPGQPFSIERIEFGPALTDLVGTLQLTAPDGTTRLAIEQARADFVGGTVALDGAVIDPAESRYDLTLLVERVDLERLLALAELKEVSGQGQLSGAIPVSVVDGAVIVRDGALKALSPGVIAFKSEAAREALASGGQAVDLMLQALEDFHYKVLELTLDKPAEGDSRVFLKLEGSNPAVLEGQPFVLNINLTSNAAPLLAALARGTEISDRLVQELLEQRAR